MNYLKKMKSYRQLVIVFLSVLMFDISQTQKEGCKALLDLCIVIDGSDSISAEDFQILRTSVGNLIDQLNIGQDQGRMGIIVYSRLLARDIPLTFDKEALKRNAADMPHPREGTNTHLGIRRMKEMFRDSNRPNVPKVGIVVTDGISKDQTQTAIEANLTKALGVNMFSVGVGPPEFMDEKELNAIASYSDQVLMVDSFGTLAKEIGNLVQLICPVDCGEPMEMPFATLLPGPTTKGTVREYRCHKGTQRVGNTHIKCLATGFWSLQDFYCKVPSSTPPPLPPKKGLCDGCAMQNGIGYAPHPEECDKFVRCEFDDAGFVQPSYQYCPFGKYWDQRDLTCKPSTMVNCPNEKCRKHPDLVSYTYGDRPSCRAYWKCNRGKSVGKCCALGFSYDPYIGCTKDVKCLDPCPPTLRRKESCNSRPSMDSPFAYHQYDPVFGWLDMTCPRGATYNSRACSCEYQPSEVPGKVCTAEVHIPFDGDCKDKSNYHHKVINHNVAVTDGNYGYFNGYDSKLIIQHLEKLKDYTDIVIKMRFQALTDKEMRGMISTGNNYGSSLMVVNSKENVHYFSKCGQCTRTINSFHLPLKVGHWNEMFYSHDGKTLGGQVNRFRNEMFALVPVQNRVTGIQIGAAPGFKNFYGFLDYVTVFLCRPDYK